MANKKSIGLPGGPNEYITDISEYLSVEGYKFNSPDVNNPFNIIESGSITMEDVEFPVLGTDNLGNTQMMQPGMTYEFPGNMVFETPMAKSGGSVSWNWKGKSYSGTLIPSMENENNRYARTKNGKIKTLPKAQFGLLDKMGAFNKIKKNLADGFNANVGYTGIARDGVNYDDSTLGILRRLYNVGIKGEVEPDVSKEIDWDSKEGNSDDTYINDKLAEASKNLEQNLFRLYLDQDQVGKYQLSESQYRPSKGDNKVDKYLSIPKEYQDNVYGQIEFPKVIDIQEYEGLPNKDIVDALSSTYNKVIDRDMVVGDYTRGIGLNEDENIYLSAYDKFDLNPFPSQVGDMSMGIGKPQDIYDRFNYVRVNADKYPEFTFLKDPGGSSSYSDALVREDNLEDYLELQRGQQKRYEKFLEEVSTPGDFIRQKGGQLPEAQFGLLKNALKPTVKFLKKYLTKADDVVPGKTSEVNFIDNIYKQQLKDAPRMPNYEMYNNPPRLEDLVSHYNKQSDGVTSVYRYGYNADGRGGAWYSSDLGDPLRYVQYGRGDGVFKADVPNNILRESYRGIVNNVDAKAGKIPGLDPKDFVASETNFKEFRLPEGIASVFQDQNFGKMSIKEYGDYIRSLKQTGGTIREYNPPGFFENIGDIFANPITAFGYTARGEDIPEGLNVNNPNRNNFEMVADIFNPFAWYQYGENAYNDFSKGEYLDGTLNALGALPVVPATIVATKHLKTPLQKIAANTNKLVSNANTNIQSGISGVRPPTSNRPFTQYWDGKNWVSSNKEQAINTLENLQNQYKTLKDQAYNKVKGAQSKLKENKAKRQALLDDFERQGFDTKELKDDAFMNMFKEYNLYNRGAKDQKRIISDMTDEFYEMRDFYKGESGGYDDLLEQITKGEKLDADLIKKHLDKSLWERIKNLGETLPGGPGDGPGLRLQQGGSMPSRSQIIDEQNKKDNQVLGLTNIIDYMVESRGGNEKIWTDLADNIAFHESGPQQRMDPQARQITKDGKKDGLGRGMFQFEPESFETAKIRYKNVADAVGYKLDENILNAESALDLNAKDQYTLFFANLIESPAVLKDYADGKSSMVDVWLKGHKNVSKEGNRKSFANSMEAAKKELGKKGFIQFSLEDLLPYKKGGESDMLDTYKNYINGKVRSQEAVNVYDKLNRIHLNDARRRGMSVPNYIMTHL